jgi:hypothetical protein
MAVFSLVPQDYIELSNSLSKINANIGHLAQDILAGVRHIKEAVAGSTYDIFYGNPTGPTFTEDILAKINSNFVRKQFVDATVGTSNLIEIAGLGAVALSQAFKKVLPSPLNKTVRKLNQLSTSLADTQAIQAEILEKLSVPVTPKVPKVKIPTTSSKNGLTV